MNDYIAIATLNDFIFCPYSIYLHSVYMESDDVMYKASPQVCGSIAHLPIDCKNASTRKLDIMSLPIYSDKLGISGKIDIFKQDKGLLIERKNHLTRIFRGQIYQLWAQYFCMVEMGYDVKELAFYDISANKTIPVELPDETGLNELKDFIDKFKHFNPANEIITINKNKCIHCIYYNLCDKTEQDNVYT